MRGLQRMQVRPEFLVEARAKWSDKDGRVGAGAGDNVDSALAEAEDARQVWVCVCGSGGGWEVSVLARVQQCVWHTQIAYACERKSKSRCGCAQPRPLNLRARMWRGTTGGQDVPAMERVSQAAGPSPERACVLSARRRRRARISVRARAHASSCVCARPRQCMCARTHRVCTSLWPHVGFFCRM